MPVTEKAVLMMTMLILYMTDIQTCYKLANLKV